VKKNQGFTIVELVVVIIILGILAATALPRFLDVQDNAQLAAAEGVQGALRSAIPLAKAKYIASSKASETLDLDEDGTNDVIVSSTSGFPTDDTTVADDDNDCAGIFAGALGGGAPAVLKGTTDAATGTAAVAQADSAYTAGTEWYAVDNADTMTACTFVYLPESAATGAYAAWFTYTVATGAFSAITETTAP
jgi:prepilin-type N-terminal cleavage/methylation domain-containing protein